MRFKYEFYKSFSNYFSSKSHRPCLHFAKNIRHQRLKSFLIKLSSFLHYKSLKVNAKTFYKRFKFNNGTKRIKKCEKRDENRRKRKGSEGRKCNKCP